MSGSSSHQSAPPRPHTTPTGAAGARKTGGSCPTRSGKEKKKQGVPAAARAEDGAARAEELKPYKSCAYR